MYVHIYLSEAGELKLYYYILTFTFTQTSLYCVFLQHIHMTHIIFIELNYSFIILKWSCIPTRRSHTRNDERLFSSVSLSHLEKYVRNYLTTHFISKAHQLRALLIILCARWQLG